MPAKVVVGISIRESALFVLLIVVIFGDSHTSLRINFCVKAVIIEL